MGNTENLTIFGSLFSLNYIKYNKRVLQLSERLQYFKYLEWHTAINDFTQGNAKLFRESVKEEICKNPNIYIIYKYLFISSSRVHRFNL